MSFTKKLLYSIHIFLSFSLFFIYISLSLSPNLRRGLSYWGFSVLTIESVLVRVLYIEKRLSYALFLVPETSQLSNRNRTNAMIDAHGCDVSVPLHVKSLLTLDMIGRFIHIGVGVCVARSFRWAMRRPQERDEQQGTSSHAFS